MGAAGEGRCLPTVQTCEGFKIFAYFDVKFCRLFSVNRVGSVFQTPEAGRFHVLAVRIEQEFQSRQNRAAVFSQQTCFLDPFSSLSTSAASETLGPARVALGLNCSRSSSVFSHCRVIGLFGHLSSRVAAAHVGQSVCVTGVNWR